MLRIFDAHVHLFDRDASTHQFLEHEDPGFKSIVGDYSALPRATRPSTLRQHRFKCVIEVFSPAASGRSRAGSGPAGQPITPSVKGMSGNARATAHSAGSWGGHAGLKPGLSRCANVCVEIAALECLFGRGWRTQDVAPWILSLIELFGPARCMFGSHMPIAGLSGGFKALYAAYGQIVAGCSADEQDQLFRGTAAAWFAARSADPLHTT